MKKNLLCLLLPLLVLASCGTAESSTTPISSSDKTTNSDKTSSSTSTSAATTKKIIVTNSPKKTEYLAGDFFDSTDLVVQIADTKSDGTVISKTPVKTYTLKDHTTSDLIDATHALTGNGLITIDIYVEGITYHGSFEISVFSDVFSNIKTVVSTNNYTVKSTKDNTYSGYASYFTPTAMYTKDLAGSYVDKGYVADVSIALKFLTRV